MTHHPNVHLAASARLMVAIAVGAIAAAGWLPSRAAAQEPAAAPAKPADSVAPDAKAPVAAPTGRPKSTAQIDAGEPRATTSPAARAAPPPAAPASPSKAATGAVGAAPARAPGSADRLDLGTATVTGDREQPKVMYIVPWKSADIGDLSGKPMNSLLDEALSPVDRDVFKREVAYYDAVKADRAPGGAAAASKQVEK